MFNGPYALTQEALHVYSLSSYNVANVAEVGCVNTGGLKPGLVICPPPDCES